MNDPAGPGGLLSNLDSALTGCRTVLGDIENRARALRRQLDEDPADPAAAPAVRGELYRLAKAVRAGTDVILARLDEGGRGEWPCRAEQPPGDQTDTPKE